jgi:streptomycin 6-kinase
VTSIERDPPKVYVRSRTPDGELFAWYTTDGSQAEVCAREAAVREVVGDRGTLAVPPLLARGESWRVEPAVQSDPIAGDAIDAVVAAAAAIAELELPAAPPGVGRERRVAKWGRRLRVASSSLGLGDALRARRLLAESDLPRVTAHGDFHPGHVLPSGGRVWVIDWELAGRRPAGYDLLTLWAHLDAAADRDRLFAGAVELVGQARRAELLRLRYAVAVLTIAAKVGEPAARNRDPAGATALLAQLPAIRAAALGD